MHPPSLPPAPSATTLWGPQFIKQGQQVLELISNYHLKLANSSKAPASTTKVDKEFQVISSVKPGYLQKVLRQNIPNQPVPWDFIMKDIEYHIIPGITHWQHPRFLPFFPAQLSPSALLGDTVANAFNQPGFSWACSPAASELETIIMDWLVDAFGLPADVFKWSNGAGGGVLQPSATEAVTVAVLAATHCEKNIEAYAQRVELPRVKPTLNANRGFSNGIFEEKVTLLRLARISKLCLYYSDAAHFCIEKAARITCIPYVRKIPSIAADNSDGNYSANSTMDIDELEKAVCADLEAGLIPFFVSGNYGATGTCACDDLLRVSNVCEKYKLWFHLDAAYAGVTAICPELRDAMGAYSKADSISINGSKWFYSMFNASMFFFRQRASVVQCLNSTGSYLRNDATVSGSVIDFKDYQLGLGRPFRSLKMYTCMCALGLEGLQANVRRHIALAKLLEFEIRKNSKRFLLEHPRGNRFLQLNFLPPAFGLVCFLCQDDSATESLAKSLNEDKEANVFVVTTTAPIAYADVSPRRVIKSGSWLRVSLAYPSITTADVTDIAIHIVRVAVSLIDTDAK